MSRQVRVRFWIELGVAAVTGLLFVLTLVWRDWIEKVFGWDPDQQSGALEWGIVVCLLAVTVLVGKTALTEWRRPLASGA